MKITCNKDCKECKKLSAKTDDKGYPWGYECMRFDEQIPPEKLERTKEFIR